MYIKVYDIQHRLHLFDRFCFTVHVHSKNNDNTVLHEVCTQYAQGVSCVWYSGFSIGDGAWNDW